MVNFKLDAETHGIGDPPVMSTLTLSDERKPQGSLRYLFMNVEDLARMAWGSVFGQDECTKDDFVPHQERELQPPPEIWLPRSSRSRLDS